jgi:capsular exopolysaccharide synthesis family protein
MSQIFDALHRSESERRGSDLPKLQAAPELLREVERQVVVRDTRWHREPAADQDPFTTIPAVKVATDPNPKLVCITDIHSLAAERFRFLGVKLRHLQQKKDTNRLLITSSVPEEGKSTVAANLACVLAKKEGLKVLLLEGDLRRPALAKIFGISGEKGLGEFLHDSKSSEPNLYRLEGLGFWILPAGNSSADSLTLLQSVKLNTLMDQLTSWFDWIIIDSPPVLPLGDTSIWMRLSDSVLLITRPGRTEKRQLQRTLEAIEQPKMVGVLVNASSDSNAKNYYRYYHGQRTLDSTTGKPATPDLSR